jgi:osmotically-inducible protein OsmY
MKRINLVKTRIFFYLVILLALQGCVAAVVTTGATGAAVAYDQRTAGTIIEDQAIELKASQAFYSDKEIDENAHVNVTSYNMVVLVTGEAPTEELINRIIELVRNIQKVSHVYNELTLAAPSSFTSRSSDSLITARVKTNLLILDNFDGTRVKVVTEKGVVYLMGLLIREEADRATESTRLTGGVQKVVKLFQYSD